MQFTIVRKDGIGETKTVDVLDLDRACAELSEGGKHPLSIVPATAVQAITINNAPTEPAPASTVGPAVEPKPLSTWEHQVIDAEAKARIETQHTALRAAGVNVDTSKQLYSTGTRMAAEGYATQRTRKQEYEQKISARDAAEALIATVRAEKRSDRVVSAREIADSLTCNGSIQVFGHAIGEQAIRGLAARLESPMLGYALGVCERMRGRAAAARSGRADVESAKRANDSDRAALASVIKRECLVASGESVKLRLREVGVNGKPDCYAMLGQDYAPADAPEAVEQLAEQLPADAKASWSYDPISTGWELRLHVWTPTPVDDQAVGEAYEGHGSVRSRDNGTSKFRGGGGILFVRCLNASTYSADDAGIARIHRGRVLYDVPAIMARALKSITVLAQAWGTNRSTALEVPFEFEGKRVTLEDVIPGFYLSMLRDNRQLANVLPGRTKEHAFGLAKAYHEERRDPDRVVRADLAQGWTRYVQDQAADVRSNAELAIGAWLVNPTPIKCALDKVLG
jgi:hypothetical protein